MNYISHRAVLLLCASSLVMSSITLFQVLHTVPEAEVAPVPSLQERASDFFSKSQMPTRMQKKLASERTVSMQELKQLVPEIKAVVLKRQKALEQKIRKEYGQKVSSLEDSLKREKKRVADLQERAAQLQKTLEQERKRAQDRQTEESVTDMQAFEEGVVTQPGQMPVGKAGREETGSERGGARPTRISTGRRVPRKEGALIEKLPQSVGEQLALEKQALELEKEKLLVYKMQLDEQVRTQQEQQQGVIASLQKELSDAQAKKAAATALGAPSDVALEQTARIARLEMQLQELAEASRDTAGASKVLSRKLEEAEGRIAAKEKELHAKERAMTQAQEALRALEKEVLPVSVASFMASYDAEGLSLAFGYLLAPRQTSAHANESLWMQRFVQQMEQLGLTKKDSARYAALAFHACQFILGFYRDAALGDAVLAQERAHAVGAQGISLPPFENQQMNTALFVAWLRTARSTYAKKIVDDYAKISGVPGGELDASLVSVLENWFLQPSRSGLGPVSAASGVGGVR